MTPSRIIILLAMLLILAVAGGGIFSWTLFMAAGILSLALFLPPRLASARSEGIVPWRSPVWLLMVYLLVMLAPLPAGISRLSGPARAEQNRKVVEIVQTANVAGTATFQTHGFSTTRSRAGTLRFLLMLLPMIAAWRILAGAPARWRDRFLQAVVVLAAAMAVTGALGRWAFPQGDTLWWVIPVPHGRPGPMGGFMNRNHFAGFCALLLPGAMALALARIEQRRWGTGLLNMFMAVALSLGIVASLSRGGLLAGAAGLGATGSLILIRGRRLTRMMTLVILLSGIATAIVIAGHSPAWRQRFAGLSAPSTESSLATRALAWRDTLRIWRHYPVLGAGPNAFRCVFPQHRATSERDARDFSENEYVQWIAETGLAGILLFLLFANRLGRITLRAWREGPSERLAAAAGATGALAAAGTHAFVDFPMHLPLYGITLAALCGCLWPCHADPRKTDAFYGTTGLAITLAMLMAGADIQLDTAGRIGGAGLADTVRALNAAPTAPVAWRRFAALLWQADTQASRSLSERAISQAVAYDPNNYPLWRQVGDRRKALGDDTGALEAYRRVRQLRAWAPIPVTLPEDS